MALKKSIQVSGDSFIKTEYGELQIGKQDITVDCYIKVEAVSGQKDNAVCSVIFENDKSNFTKSYEFVPDMDGPNFIKQAYLHLKTLSEFSGATDA